jgi:hypothetical protein
MHACVLALVANQALMVLFGSHSMEVVAVYYRQRFCLLTLAEFGGILLDIAEPVRGKLREKLRRIEREQYSLLETARSP